MTRTVTVTAIDDTFYWFESEQAKRIQKNAKGIVAHNLSTLFFETQKEADQFRIDQRLKGTIIRTIHDDNPSHDTLVALAAVLKIPVPELE